jgi:hypothetical protein
MVGMVLMNQVDSFLGHLKESGMMPPVKLHNGVRWWDKVNKKELSIRFYDNFAAYQYGLEISQIFKYDDTWASVPDELNKLVADVAGNGVMVP